MQIIPIRDLKDTVEIERLCAKENGPVFVTKNGYGRLVVMDIDYYQDLMDQIHEASVILEGLKDVQNNNLVDGKQTLDDLKEKHNV